jgi:hypothetical protein
MINKEQTYFQYQFVATKLAKHYSKKFQRPLEETQSHADFALCLLIYEDHCHFDPALQTLETWLGIKIYWHLKEIYTRGIHPHCDDLREPVSFKEHHDTDWLNAMDNGDKFNSYAPGGLENTRNTHTVPDGGIIKPTWIQNLKEEIKEEGLSLLQIILDAPSDLLAEILPQKGRTQEKKQNHLYNYLVDVLDWNPDKVDQAFNELKACL